MVVYRVTNRVNGKVYVGQTRRKAVNRRWNEHVSHAGKGSPYHLHNAIRKYGSDTFAVEVLYRAKTMGELLKMETFFIVLHQSHKPENGYNMTLGGDGTFGYKLTSEQVEKMRQRQLGRSPSDEARAKESETHKEIWKSRSDVSKTEIVKQLRQICSAGGKSLKGRKRTPEECAAISKGRSGIGRPQSDEVRKKIANTLRERKRPLEVIQKIVETKRLKRLAAKAGA